MSRKKSKNRKIVIDLTGPQGNAFVLLGLASRFCRQAGIDPEPIMKDMKSGDYENLLQVFDSYFGDLVILER